MPTRHTAHRQRLALACLLLVTLLAAQTLGLLHRVVHVAAAAPHGPSQVQPDAPTAALQVLFAHRDQSADCRLFDQLSHADGLIHADLDRPCLPPAALDAPFHAGRHVAAQAAGYLARGPPPTV